MQNNSRPHGRSSWGAKSEQTQVTADLGNPFIATAGPRPQWDPSRSQPLSEITANSSRMRRQQTGVLTIPTGTGRARRISSFAMRMHSIPESSDVMDFSESYEDSVIGAGRLSTHQIACNSIRKVGARQHRSLRRRPSIRHIQSENIIPIERSSRISRTSSSASDPTDYFSIPLSRSSSNPQGIALTPDSAAEQQTKLYRINWNNRSMFGDVDFSTFQQDYSLAEANRMAQEVAWKCCDKGQEVILEDVEDGKEKWTVWRKKWRRGLRVRGSGVRFGCRDGGGDEDEVDEWETAVEIFVYQHGEDGAEEEDMGSDAEELEEMEGLHLE